MALQRCPPPPPHPAKPPPDLNPPTWLAKLVAGRPPLNPAGRGALKPVAGRKPVGLLANPVRCGATGLKGLMARLPEKPAVLPVKVPKGEEAA